MPPDPKREVSLESLIRRAAQASERRARMKALAELARRVGSGPRVTLVFQQLLSVGSNGPRLGLEYLARLPGKSPPELVKPALILLKQRKVPTPTRLAAAGNLLAAVPDTPEGIRPVLAAVTGKLSRYRTLERLIQLQGRVVRCDTLDKTVAATEAALALKCPKCTARLTRTALIKHLWLKHKLVFERGSVRDPQKLLDQAMTLGAQQADEVVEQLDEAFDLTGLYYPAVPPRQVFQALAARGSALPTQLEPLLDRAAEDRCGVCPVCLSSLPDPIPALPPALSLGSGRLVGERHAVDVVDAPGGRTVTITTPAGAVADAGSRKLSTRILAVLCATPLLLAALGAAFVLPDRALLAVGLASLAGWLAYASLRFLRKPLPDANDVAVDRAWSAIVPGIGRKLPAVRFLTRLCRTSLTSGTSVDRTPAVWELVEQAAVLADRGGVHLQLLAVARVLQICDGAKAGREKIAGMVGVFEPFLRGELPLAYAEAVAETLLAAHVLAAGEGERLTILLLEQAFGFNYHPLDLANVLAFAPWLRRLLREPSDYHLRALHAVWRGRQQRRWSEFGAAETVFELANGSPSAAKRVLAAFPDALLQVELDDATESELGPVLVCTSGVVAGGATVADPDAVVQFGASWRELQFGSHRIGLDRKLSSRVPGELKGWPRFRVRVLLPSAEKSAARPAGASRSAGVLSPLAVNCTLCGTVSVARTGQLGVRWEEVAAC